ncbi:MAG: hypothetical protein NC110_08815, partial [Ruminococcus sp.]|nr:hypothetical protein [Ruminococcus sp.]
MNDNVFDDFIADVVADESVSKKVPEINPWKNCILLLSCGLLLLMFQLNFAGLNYILPSLGLLLTYCGVRSLKKENKWFHASWIISLVYLIHDFAAYVISATPLNEASFNGAPYIGTALMLALFLSLHFGFEKVFEKAGIIQHQTPFLFALIWETFLFVIVLAGLGELFAWVAIVFIVAVFLIIRSIYKLKEVLPQVGYEFLMSKPLISNKTTVIVYAISTVVIVCSLIACFNHTVGEATDLMIDASLQQRQTLLDIGFPKEIINDITDEDVELLSKCKSTLVEGRNYKIKSKSEDENGNWIDDDISLDDGNDTTATDPVQFYRV